MTNPTPLSPAAQAVTDFRALCAELVDCWENDCPVTLAEVMERARAALAEPEPANGEVAELVAWLRGANWDRQRQTLATRAADLLELLEQIAYAASDFICGTRFPEFANEHGGTDNLMDDLCRLVAQFEHGPRPVPGVDVPGADGDWGGLEELCNAEGVDLRIGVPLLQRAREAWKYASQAVPVPVSERLPGPWDCDAEGECYWFDPEGSGAWYQDTYQGNYTHWLPAHALPLPE